MSSRVGILCIPFLRPLPIPGGAGRGAPGRGRGGEGAFVLGWRGTADETSAHHFVTR
jgi:hypothetical protein